MHVGEIRLRCVCNETGGNLKLKEEDLAVTVKTFLQGALLSFYSALKCIHTCVAAKELFDSLRYRPK